VCDALLVTLWEGLKFLLFVSMPLLGFHLILYILVASGPLTAHRPVGDI
jgi:hypothetical protein